jgi:hypothetical protein
VTTLQLNFPEPWALLPVSDGGPAVVEELVAGMADVGPDAQDATRQYLTSLLRALTQTGVDGFASLTVPDGDSGIVQAFCAVGVTRGSGMHDELRTIAENGLHPGLDRTTTTVPLPLGAAVRSSAIRFADELVDDDGLAPYVAEVRFAVPLPDERIGVLHFETLSLVYLQELERLFDTIASTARVT